MSIKSKQFNLPKKLILDTLVGLPQKFEMPVLGGLDTESVRIMDFSLKCDYWVIASFIFDNEIQSFYSIHFYFEGIERLSLEESDELDKRRYREELLILNQAIKILMKHKGLTKYRKAMEKSLIIRNHPID